MDLKKYVTFKIFRWKTKKGSAEHVYSNLFINPNYQTAEPLVVKYSVFEDHNLLDNLYLMHTKLVIMVINVQESTITPFSKKPFSKVFSSYCYWNKYHRLPLFARHII